MITSKQLKEMYENGRNISAVLRKELGVSHNTQEIIEISYDIQTGSYIQKMQEKDYADFKEDYSKELADIILSLHEPKSILEAGVGEATTLSSVLKHLNKSVASYGFDLSWSRAAYAKNWLHSQGINNTLICSGDLLNIPFLDNSIDVVYTSHSIEPNGGQESRIISELYRVTRKFLILLEPDYKFSSQEAKQRMDSHGYCKNLDKVANMLGYNVLRHEPFAYSYNPLNPTAITIISKQSDIPASEEVLACPKLKTPLIKIANAMYSPDSLTAYPILDDIACLRIENGIFASKYQEVMED